MSVYIEKGKTKEILTALLLETAINNTGHQCDASEVFEDIAKNRIDTWLNLIKSADVVEVVRCRDCKKLDSCRTSTVWAVPPGDDWFCADGKRREQNELMGSVL